SATTGSFTDGDAEPVEGEMVSSGYFALLGVRPVLGRVFDASVDDLATTQPVAIVGYDVWRNRFGTSDDVVGRTVEINGVRLTVMGVMPAGFEGLSGRSSVWMPATIAPRVSYADYLVTNQNFISVVGRLRDGTTLERARAELTVVGRDVDRRHPVAGLEP